MSVDDLLRAVKNSVSNFAQSNAGRVIGMEALRARPPAAPSASYPVH